VSNVPIVPQAEKGIYALAHVYIACCKSVGKAQSRLSQPILTHNWK